MALVQDHTPATERHAITAASVWESVTVPVGTSAVTVQFFDAGGSVEGRVAFDNGGTDYKTCGASYTLTVPLRSTVVWVFCATAAASVEVISE